MKQYDAVVIGAGNGGLVAAIRLLQGGAKTLLVFLFLWLTSPVSSHLIAEMEVMTVPEIEKECEVEER